VHRRYFICDNKLKILGWKERTSWEDGLQRTIDWCAQHAQRAAQLHIG
jgi:UDP-glucose 4,6-dehydratase